MLLTLDGSLARMKDPNLMTSRQKLRPREEWRSSHENWSMLMASPKPVICLEVNWLSREKT